MEIQELTYFRNVNDLNEILKENPKYFKIYFKKQIINGKSTISLCKGEGDILYCVSNTNHNDLKLYLKKKENFVKSVIEKRNEQSQPNISNEPAKKMKQQNLFSFFTKK